MATAMDTDMKDSPSYTIVRIKRKRHEEPLDALVVESKNRRKKTRAGVDLFQFAETVEGDAWDDERQTQDLQERISALARNPEPLTSEQPASEPIPAPVSAPAPQVSRQPSSNHRYSIVQKDLPSEHQKSRYPTSPPRVIPTSELRKPTPSFTLLDAVPSEPSIPGPPEESEMDKFMPLLQDYLKLNDISVSTPPSSENDPVQSSSVASSTTSMSLSSDLQEDTDFVYDVFYRRAITLSEWNRIANVGFLTGLPPSLNDPNESDSDSEPEDEDDEDSNAEDYYKNDYPDEEASDSGSSDMFHDAPDSNSDYDDTYDGEEHDWR